MVLLAMQLLSITSTAPSQESMRSNTTLSKAYFNLALVS
jgi:hypothetical protein